MIAALLTVHERGARGNPRGTRSPTCLCATAFAAAFAIMVSVRLLLVTLIICALVNAGLTADTAAALKAFLAEYDRLLRRMSHCTLHSATTCRHRATDRRCSQSNARRRAATAAPAFEPAAAPGTADRTHKTDCRGFCKTISWAEPETFGQPETFDELGIR